MRILVTGANGQLGRELRDCLARMEIEIGPLPEAYRGAEVDYAGRAELDIADPASVSAWFGGHGPYDLVVNCASATNVDRCETDRETALLVNGTAVGHIAAAAEAQGAALVHVSTDYVFSGTKGAPYIESDEPDPVSFYGRSKLVGERNALGLCSRAFVVRTSWLYGRHGRNFVNTMLALGASQARVSVVDDQFGNPTNANDLVFELLAIALTDEYGVYHCSGNGTCSWFEFARSIMAAARPGCTVVPCTTEEWNALHPQAPRPHDSSLANRRLEDTVGDRMRRWPEAIASYLASRTERG